MYTIEYTSLNQTERLQVPTEKEAADLVRARWGADVHCSVGKRWQPDPGSTPQVAVPGVAEWVDYVEGPCVLVWAEQPPDPLDGAPGAVFGPAGWAPDAALWTPLNEKDGAAPSLACDRCSKSAGFRVLVAGDFAYVCPEHLFPYDGDVAAQARADKPGDRPGWDIWSTVKALQEKMGLSTMNVPDPRPPQAPACELSGWIPRGSL